jgi:type IV pilus assembly protein PilC
MALYRKAKHVGRMTPEEQMFLAQQLALMMRVGIPIPKAFAILAARAKGHQREMLLDIGNSVTAGNTLESSMQRYQLAFNSTFLGLVHIGELRGDLSPVLDKFVAITRVDQRLARKFKAAMTYPAVVITAMIILGIGATVFIFPQIEQMFSSFNMKLPVMTRAVIAVSEFMSHYGIYLLAALSVALLTTLALYRKHLRVREVIDRLLLRIPLFGRLSAERQISTILRNLAMLLKTGMGIVDILEACRAAMTNAEFRSSLENAKDQMRKGNRLYLTLRRFPRLYPQIAVELIAIGEETGTLEEVSGDLADYYEERVSATLENMPALIEPALIFIMGVGVAIIAIAIMMPMYQFSLSV